MRTFVVLTAALCALLTGCGAEEPAPRSDDALVSGTGTMADFDFEATTIDGSELEASRLAGKPAVLWFWAPWCPTCRAQVPNLSALGEQYDGQVSVVGVGGLDDDAAIRDVAEQIPNVTHVIDERGEVWRHFEVTEQSSYTVIGAGGEVVSEGYLDDAVLNDLVAGLVAEQP